jgi:putative ABC transport system permease protein
LTDLLQDLRFGIRALRRNPGFATAIVLTLALGIGATTAIFSIVNTVLLRALPFPRSDRLVRIRNYSLAPGGERNRYGVTPRNFVALQEQADVLSGVVGLYATSATLTGGERPERLEVVGVSSGWAQVLGVDPVAGRLFSVDEERQGQGSLVAIVALSLAESRFGGAAPAIGRELLLDERRYTVVGVMPGRFAFPYAAAVWVPWRFDPSDGRNGSIAVFGRLRDGVTLARTQADIEIIARRLEAEFPLTNRGVGLDAEPIRASFMDGEDRIVAALLAAVAFLLLIACANVANLLLARGVSREREFAVRTALGAGRLRQVRQLLTESLVLSVAGGAVGLLFAAWLVGSLGALVPDVLSGQLGLSGADLDGRALGFSLLLALATGTGFGLVPAWTTTRRGSHDLLREGARASGSPRSRHLLGGFVLSEVALAVALLVGAGTMVQNFARLERARLGFDTSSLLTLRVSLEGARYADGARREAFVTGALEAIRATPGVVEAGLTTVNPLCCGDWGARITVEGRPTGPDAPPQIVAHQYVAPGFFRAMGIRLIKGRLFTERDRRGSLPVVVVDERFANRFWPGQDPIGRRVRRERADAEFPWLTVVGVVGAIRDASDYTEAWYLPYAQGALGPSAGDLHFMVRAQAVTPQLVQAVQGAIVRVDPQTAVFETTTMAVLRAERLSADRMGAVVGGLLGTFGLLLAALGVYGVIAFSVGCRRREISVRMALGASRLQVLAMVLRQGLAMALPGVALGLIGVAVLVRVSGSTAFGAQGPTAAIYAVVAGTLTAVAVLASLLPARRAAEVDPMSVLKE